MTAKDVFTVEKKVPISLILAFLVQFAGIVWWAADIGRRIDRIEKDIIHLTKQQGVTDTVELDMKVRMARIEERTEAISRDTRTMIDRLERVLAVPRP